MTPPESIAHRHESVTHCDTLITTRENPGPPDPAHLTGPFFALDLGSVAWPGNIVSLEASLADSARRREPARRAMIRGRGVTGRAAGAGAGGGSGPAARGARRLDLLEGYSATHVASC